MQTRGLSRFWNGPAAWMWINKFQTTKNQSEKHMRLVWPVWKWTKGQLDPLFSEFKDYEDCQPLTWPDYSQQLWMRDKWWSYNKRLCGKLSVLPITKFRSEFRSFVVPRGSNLLTFGDPVIIHLAPPWGCLMFMSKCYHTNMSNWDGDNGEHSTY